MSNPTIHGKTRPVTASDLLDALAGDLTKIKSEDKLTWATIGEVLRRGEDQAAKYADGTATMDWIAYKRGEMAWNGRFTGAVDRLLQSASEPVDPKQAQSCLLKASLALSLALEDGELTDAEILANRKPLEDAADKIARLLQRVKPRSVG